MPNSFETMKSAGFSSTKLTARLAELAIFSPAALRLSFANRLPPAVRAHSSRHQL